MKKQTGWILFIMIVMLTVSLVGCSGSPAAPTQATTNETAAEQSSAALQADESSAADAATVERPEGWNEETHGADVEANYAVVFPQDKVNTLNITISAENWQTMLDDMTAQFGEMGNSENARGVGQPGAGMQPPADGSTPQASAEGMQPPADGAALQGGPGGGMQPPADSENPQGRPGGMGGNAGGPVSMVTETPVSVTSTVQFNNETWSNVGIRFRGNSTLVSSWSSGTYKISLKLDFNKFEDDYPEIAGQTFYGFQELSLISNANDSSLLREKVVADIFREAGVPAPQTAFYAVYIDYGEGPKYFGLYTMVETVEDTLIETQFSDSSGNVYKPEGNGATFAAGSFNEESFEKETNKDAKDWSDIQALFDALHSDLRTSDPQTWRANLEAVFNVDEFLRWLAVNSVIQNWDSYGSMSHNYYLYKDPTTGQFNWIPWDNNMALTGGMRRNNMGGGMGQNNPNSGMDQNTAGSAAGQNSASNSGLDLSSVNENWPLINFLIKDEVYKAKYDAYIAETINGAFAPARMTEIYTTFHNLIQPYVTGENGEQEGYTQLRSADAFDQSLNELIEHVNSRFTAATEYLNAQ
jgi:spore coat protein H